MHSKFNSMYKRIFFLLLLFNSIISFSQTNHTYVSSIFSFSLRVDSVLNSDSINYTCVVKSITVTRVKDKRKIQVITPEENYPHCGLPKEQVFIIEDMNFDGYNDIRLLQFLPASPNLPYYYWLYNPATGKFQRQKALEDLTSPEFDPTKKLIYSFWRSSCCDHGLSTYKYHKGRPLLIEESEVKEQDGMVTTTLKKLVKGKMTVVKRTVEKVEE